MEVWKPVVGHEDTHRVSNLGRVYRLPYSTKATNGQTRRIKGKLLEPGLDTHGYLQASIKGKLRFVHRLVAEAFMGPKPAGFHTCHNDGNPANNRTDNLRYDTQKGNAADKRLHGTAMLGEKCHLARLTEEQVKDALRRVAAGERIVEVAKDFGVTHSTISVIVSGKSWAHLSAGVVQRPDKKRQAKMSREAAEDIIRRCRAGEPNAQIARSHGVDPSIVSRMKNGQSWGWLHVGT